MEIFLWYFLISGTLTAHLTNSEYDELLEKHPQIGVFEKNWLLVCQFFIGFLVFPFWIPQFIKNYFIKKKTLKIKKQTEKHIKWTQEVLNEIELENKTRYDLLKIKYANCIQDIDIPGEKFIHLESGGIITVDDMKYTILLLIEANFLKEDYHIMINGKYYIILGPEQAKCMNGFKTICIITNPNAEK